VRASLRGEQRDYTVGPLRRAIVLLAIPMVLEMVMESVFAVADVYFVASLGAEAVATVGLTESVLTLVYAVAIGLAMATTATVARRIGEKDTDGAITAATQAIVVGLLVSVAVGVPAFTWADDILRLMGADEATVAAGTGYTRLLLGTNAVILLLFLHNAIFRGAGDAVLAMRSLWLANGINLVLDPCLIFGLGPFPELGLTGAAVATTIGRGTGVAFQFWMLRKGGGGGRIKLAGPAFHLNLGVALRLLRVSVGGIAQMLVATASWVALMRIVSPFGTQALAGYTIAIRIIIFALMPSWGLCNAAATLVGQNLGAKKPDRAERAVWLTGLFNTAALGLVTVIFVAAAEPLIGLFSEEPEIRRVGAEALKIIAYGYIAYAWGMVMIQAFNGAGDTATPTYVNLVCFWACQIPLAWYLAREVGMGPPGVFWSVMLSESLLAVVSILLFRRGRWKTREV
jgi:putative MATE family efflux protein